MALTSQWELTLTGAPELVKAFTQIAEAIAGAVLLEALETSAEPMAERMAELAPRGPDPPHLADNILIVPGKHDAETAEVFIGPAKEFFYGWMWEHGWKFHAAHPFARPAFDTTKDTVLARFGALVWNQIARQAAIVAVVHP